MTFEIERVGSDPYAELIDAVTDRIHLAMQGGLSVDVIASVVVSVAADYVRLIYGDHGLDALATVVLKRAEHPMPEMVQ